jgi:hypothetical protein
VLCRPELGVHQRVEVCFIVYREIYVSFAASEWSRRPAFIVATQVGVGIVTSMRSSGSTVRNWPVAGS